MSSSATASASRVLRALARAALVFSVVACSGTSMPTWNLGDVVPKTGATAVARLLPKNTSVTGTITFTQRAGKVGVAGTIYELRPGAHRIYIHEVGNCSSPNAASAGKVWSIPGMPAGRPRLGDLPQIVAGTEGRADLVASIDGISVGDGSPTDVIGHSVVVHDGMNTDPRPQFGVRNDWLACGVIERL